MKLNRIILVIDDDLSSYKGILRFSDKLAAQTHYFANRAELLNWLGNNKTPLTLRKQLFCVVFDAKHSDIFKIAVVLDFLRHAPKICISRPAHLAKALRMINTRIFDFVEKPFMLDVMRQTLNQAFISHEQENRVQLQFTSLTKREMEICELIAEALTSKEISEKLAISIKTVKAHRANLMRKIQAKSITELLHAYNLFNACGKNTLVIPKHYSV